MSPVAIVSGSGGLIGSETVRRLVREGFDVVGLDNDMRRYFFGDEASTRPMTERLQEECGSSFRPLVLDIRDAGAVARVVRRERKGLELVVHTAAQPSHDWAAREALTDFAVNANGTLNMLEAVRHHKPEATFVHCSTSKVYGDRPNFLPLIEGETRLYLPDDHQYAKGIDTTMSIDGCLHSIFGASKVAADVMVQEYGRYFDMPTVCFRPGCLTGPAHAGAKLHGFLSYLMKCAVTGDRYTVIGYGGKQVRCNIHSCDVVEAFMQFHRNPRAAAVYNLGGGMECSISMLEAIDRCEVIAGQEMNIEHDLTPRIGDHRWWVSDIEPLMHDYPDFKITKNCEDMLQEIHDENVERWGAR